MHSSMNNKTPAESNTTEFVANKASDNYMYQLFNKCNRERLETIFSYQSDQVIYVGHWPLVLGVSQRFFSSPVRLRQ